MRSGGSGLNPRDKRPGERRSLRTSGRAGGPIWYFLGGLLLLILVQTWFLAPTGRQLSYSEFKTAVRAGQVAEVYVGEQTIRGTLKREADGTKNFSTTRIEDPKLLEDLDATGVKYTGEFVSRWLPEILGWILPLIFIFVIWSYFSRRILNDRRDELESVTRRLLEIEVMEGEELRRLLGVPPVARPSDDATPLPPGIN